MNVLAHIYLSGDNDHIKIGNFIGDYVKGHEYELYPPDIRKGILIHRSIDSFTDKHPLVRKSKKHLVPSFDKYAGIFVDVFYDHFLSVHWNKFANGKLDIFIKNLYLLLMKNLETMPEEISDFIARFVERDWISYYGEISGIEYVLKNLSLNSSLPGNIEKAISILREQYQSFEEDFLEYFPLLTEYVVKKYDVSLPDQSE